MKKNMEFVMLDQDSVRELLQNAGGIEESAARDFYHALKNMQDGSCETILLGMGELPQMSRDTRIRCSDITIEPNTRRVTRGDEEISLTPKEFDILCLLAKNRGQVFTKEQIYKSVWGDDYIMDDSNVMAFIRKLRKKIEPNADQPKYILTVWGLGYKFSDKD